MPGHCNIISNCPYCVYIEHIIEEVDPVNWKVRTLKYVRTPRFMLFRILVAAQRSALLS